MTNQTPRYKFTKVVTVPGAWTAEDSENFHKELCKHTEFSDSGSLLLNHYYFNNQDIQILEKLEIQYKDEIEKGPYNSTFARTDILYYLEAKNDALLDSNYHSMFYLLLDLQTKTGLKFTSKQLNNKHVNTRSRISVPFMFLHERGYFNRASNAINISSDLSKMGLVKEFHVHTTNMEAKNIPNIKALYTFMTQREAFWCSETSSAPTGNPVKDSSETIRWFRAMIATHGEKMVRFLDECVLSLLNSYLINLVEQDRYDDSLRMIGGNSSFDQKINVFNMVLSELKAGGSKKEIKKTAGAAEASSSKRRAQTEESGGNKKHKDSGAAAVVARSDASSFLDWVAGPGYNSRLAAVGEQILRNAGAACAYPTNARIASSEMHTQDNNSSSQDGSVFAYDLAFNGSGSLMPMSSDQNNPFLFLNSL
ncbi:hypothetical protein H4R99_003443 [Coemansia sp. RSA 1722]|nr:hypothetical protein LPJ57_001324 [Coemansia sp. RSA 486]KAJ2238161.1 hypothetical protein IWW45_000349 [Coemansia sp. RSA 485]KAJ2600137.1 hypothetical protein H4R99_003443 [Coemansia sp. RSA 1722]KAJ2601207.1 hypothetical protein GGF39_001378 [Coemansia sp. RSA 1721]KAJ2637572.1 hypothetical protein GGF40_002270 [Coemansia sp. RSA 1286]